MSYKKAITMSYIIYKPWGWYEEIKEENTYKLKKIGIYPNSRLSLQQHYFRSEYWIIVQGQGEVQIINKKDYVEGKQGAFINISSPVEYNTQRNSIFIPCNMLHRIKNTGNINLIFIEVQLGSAFREDDIIRFEDDYGRV